MKLKDIDFRVWDISKKVFYNDLGFSILPSSSCSKTFRMDLAITFAKNLESACMLISNYEVDFYTGFRDRNDKKIYEGDIVAHYAEGGGIEYYSKVVFNQEKGAFEFVCIEHPITTTFDELANPDIGVVGNIHENKDL
ncbi:YopX family protein [Helicobacter rodentium]|uniref:YopX family protein n=1 Tax=Helicobacter rodentium TaxID=59617 RepID=UPI00047CD85E|nr:YopX family protein [Helicobacter rodentium]